MSARTTTICAELPRLQRLTRKVADGHGDQDPRLITIAERFEELTDELLPHQAEEEENLFPALLEAASNSDAAPNRDVLVKLIDEHTTVGGLLSELRELSDGYTPQEWMCNTTRATIHSLSELEADLHQHIHKENNILFPRFM